MHMFANIQFTDESFHSTPIHGNYTNYSRMLRHIQQCDVSLSGYCRAIEQEDVAINRRTKRSTVES